MGSLAKACRYVVRIIRPGERVSEDLTYLCEATEFPGRGFNNVDLRYYGPNFKLPFQTTYEDINMTFVCRSQALEREFFDDWMEQINPTSHFDFEYRDSYSTEITIFQMAEYGDFTHEPTYSFSLFDAYPVLVNAQPVTWADDNFLRLTVTFTYTKWRRRNKDLDSDLSQDMFENQETDLTQQIS
jgi:hypothetical protein